MTDPVIEGAPSTGPEPTHVDPDNIFSNSAVVAAIAKARQEEKDKLYPRLSKQDEKFKLLEDELAVLKQEREARLAQEKTKADELTAKAEAKRKEEVSAKTLLDEKAAEWESKFTDMQNALAQKDAIFAKEKEFLELQQYTQSQVMAASDDIDPRFVDYISGNTREEVDASILRAKAKTEELITELQAAQLAARQTQRGVSPAGYSTSGPLDTEPFNQSISASDLQNMPMSKYAELRSKLGIGGNSQGSNRGLFG